MNVPLFFFIQKMSRALSSFVQVVIWEDKLDYLKNPSKDIKNYFGIVFLWIPINAATLEGKVRNHVKLMQVINSRRGFSKGTVLCGGY